MQQSVAYLIQGFFFQKRQSLGVQMVSEAHGGVRTVVHEAMVRSMFAGVIFFDRGGTTEWSGLMGDPYGDSELNEVSLVEKSSLRFVKKYDNRQDLILYSFAFDEPSGMWVGGYSGIATGKGFAKCITTPVPNEFFLPM